MLIHCTNKSPLYRYGSYISQISHAMNEETKMVPSQCACADGFKSLLHKHTALPLDSSLFQAWLQACPWGNRAKTLERAVWAVILPWYLGFHCLGSLTRLPKILENWVFSLISAVIVSAGWERISFPVEVSLAYEPLLWSFISVFASCTVMNKIQRWHDPSEVQHGEAMNKDEDSSF